MTDIGELSDKSYWSSFYDVDGFNKGSKLKSFFSYSVQNEEYFRIIKRFIMPNFKNILEVGCAPGNYLIKASKRLNLTPFGVEYTSKGKSLTEVNLNNAGIRGFEIFHSDVFDSKFQDEKSNSFDVVFSNGFVEHFKNFKLTIKSHSNLVKDEGLLVISIPNLKYLNSLFNSQEVRDICNEDCMDLDFIRNNLPNDLEIKYLNYYGGLFNIGLFHYRNYFLEKIRVGCFIFQRLIIEPVFILLLKLGISFNWRYSSPAIVLICSKK